MFDLLFSFKGRIGRLTFFGAMCGVTLFSIFVGLVVASAKGYALPQSPAEYTATMEALALPLVPLRLLTLWITFAIGAKRLHDLNRSGWLQLWIFLALMVAMFLAGFARGVQSGPLMIISGLLCIAVGLYSIWISIKMLFFPGDDGENDYGAPGGDDVDAAQVPARPTRVQRVVSQERLAPAVTPQQGGFGRRR